MKVTVNRIKLAYAVNAVSKALITRATTENAYQTVSLIAEDDSLTLIAGNGEIIVECKIEAEVTEQGRKVVQGKLFVAAIQKTTCDEITLLGGDAQCTVIYDGGSMKIPVVTGEGVKSFAKLQDSYAFNMKIEDFKRLTANLQSYVAKDDSRPVMKGICLRSQDDQLTAVACDGYRLAKTVVSIDKTGADNIDIIVPIYAMQVISSLVDDKEEGICIQYSKSPELLCVEQGGMKITTRLYTGTYINYQNLIPTTFETETQATREEVLQVLDRAMLIGENANTVNLSVGEDNINFSAVSGVGELSESIPTNTKGKLLDIVFNTKYVLDAVKSLKEKKMTLKFNTSVSPMIVEEASTLYLILPVRMPVKKGA